MNNFLQRLTVAAIVAVLTTAYAVLIGALILIQFPAQVLRTIATLILNLCALALVRLHQLMRALNPE